MAAFHGISTQDVNEEQIAEEDDKTNPLTLLMFECICINLHFLVFVNLPRSFDGFVPRLHGRAS